MHRYKIWNGAAATTAAQAVDSTTSGVKTTLQLATPSTRQIQLISWGFSCDEAPDAGNGVVELLQTNTAATVTASVAADIVKLDPNQPDSLLTLGTSATGYTATAEGTVSATRVFDVAEIPTVHTNVLHYTYQWMPDERPIVAVSRFLRVRTTFPDTVTSLVAWVCWDE